MDPVFIGTDEVHPAAQMFPEMSAEELAALTDSIREHGIRVSVVFHDGKLLDGRNRLRAYLAAGFPRARLPWTGLPPDADPYTYAWDRNCERLDYSPGLKAQIKARILSASGELARVAAEAKAAADALRAEKVSKVAAARERKEDGTLAPGVPSRGGTPGRKPKPKNHKSKAAQAIAAAAGVSASTAERQLRKAETDEDSSAPSGRLPAGHPLHAKRPAPVKWGEPPHDVDGLAEYLALHLGADDLSDLAKLLSRRVAA